MPTPAIEGQPQWQPISTHPADNQRVICLEDYSPVGRAYRGIDLYYYRAGIGFVANPGDDDPYGMITHWLPLLLDAKATPTASWHELVSAQLLWEHSPRPPSIPLRRRHSQRHAPSGTPQAEPTQD
jgi:hypothetical protein